jgi:hypothetical protein
VFDQCVAEGFERAISFEGKASSGVSGRSCVSKRSAVGLVLDASPHRNNTLDSHLFDSCPVAIRSRGGKRTVLRSPIFRKSRLGDENAGVSFEGAQDLRRDQNPPFPLSGKWFSPGSCQTFEVSVFFKEEDTRMTGAFVKSADSRVFACEDSRGCTRVLPGDSLMYEYSGASPRWAWRLL